MKNFLVRNRASIWLSFAILILAAVMMQPSFASMICMGLLALVVFLMRWIAHIEGRVSP